MTKPPVVGGHKRVGYPGGKAVGPPVQRDQIPPLIFVPGRGFCVRRNAQETVDAFLVLGPGSHAQRRHLPSLKLMASLPRANRNAKPGAKRQRFKDLVGSVVGKVLFLPSDVSLKIQTYQFRDCDMLPTTSDLHQQ